MQTKLQNEVDFSQEVEQNFQTGKTDEAISLARKALRKFPDSVVLNLKLAEVYLSKKKFKKAETHSLHAYKQDLHVDSLVLLMNSLIYQGDLENAILCGTNHINSVEPHIKIKHAFDSILDYLIPLEKQGIATSKDYKNIISIFKAFQNPKRAAFYVERIPDKKVLLEERQKLCQFWAPKMQARRFINPRYTVSEFFQKLNEMKINYVVLRWFENLPEVGPDEDIDILAADEDIDLLSTLLVPYPYENAQPIDLYSVTGQRGTNYCMLPYYQANLAEQILKKKQFQSDLFYVPSPEDYFYSLCYHAIYHKAEKSGIPVQSGPTEKLGSHDYHQGLKNVARKAGLPEPQISLESLHETLKNVNWCPSIDVIRKLSEQGSDWLAGLHPVIQSKSAVSVFILRDWARDKNLLEVLKQWFESEGQIVLYCSEIDNQILAKTSNIIRGGNWEKGPWPAEGGGPYAAYVLLDQNPQEVSEEELKFHPFRNNKTVGRLKEHLRVFINSKLPADQHVNCVHSTDDDLEAMEYTELLFPESVKQIQEARNELDRKYFKV